MPTPEPGWRMLSSGDSPRDRLNDRQPNVIVDPGTDTLVGVHIFGSGFAELINLCAVH